MSVRTAQVPAGPEAPSAQSATLASTAQLKQDALQHVNRLPTGSTAPAEGTANASTSSAATDNQSDNQFPTYKPLAKPSDGSTKPWSAPRSVAELAAQANQMATALLNGEVTDLESVRVYANLARTVTAAKTIEVQRARFLREEPNLSLVSPESGNKRDVGTT